VPLDLGTAAIADRPDTGLRRHAVDRARHRLGEEVRETLTVAAEPAQRSEHVGADLEAGQALEYVGCPARLAELAVVHDVEPGLDLTKHDFLDRAPEELVALPRPCAFARPNELGRPHEAADVCRQDSIVTAEHPGVRGCRGGEILAAARRARPSDLIACAMNTGQGSGNTSIDSCLVVAFRATAQLQQSGERKKQYRRDPLTFDWGVVMKMQRAGRPGTTVPAGSLSSPAGWLAVTVLAQACSTALAQESQQRAGVLEEVIVTAEFREANVQDTPIAIT